MLNNLGDCLQVLDLIPNAAVTADGNGTGVDLITLTGEIAIVCDVPAPVAGTNPTLDLIVEDSADNSSFAALSPATAFTQVAAEASVQKISLNKDAVRRYLRIRKDIGGTDNPQYLVSVKAYGVKRVMA